MNKNLLLLAGALLLAAGFSACVKDKCQSTSTYKVWKPIIKSFDEIRVDIKQADPTPLKKPGNIYLYQQWLLINEQGEGIHVFDNSNPDKPENVAFIKIPGNVDMAMKDGYLYADNYMDLLAIDMKDPVHPKLLSRQEQVFPYNYYGPSCIVGYTETQETTTVDCSSPNWGTNYYIDYGDVTANVFVKSDFTPQAFQGSNGAPSVGVGGSMARFTIANNYLYTVDYSFLRPFNLSNPAQPTYSGTPVAVDFHLETLFSMGDQLFVGSNNGTFIYDASVNPATPVKLGEFYHARSCDPVVADAETAYITLHDGSQCLGFENQLDVVNIKDIAHPTLIKTYSMKHPLGLGIRDKVLFLCDDGFKVFDATDPATIDQHLLSHLTDINPTDVIPVPWNKDLILVSANGIFQYDASDPAQLKQRSVINIQ